MHFKKIHETSPPFSFIFFFTPFNFLFICDNFVLILKQKCPRGVTFCCKYSISFNKIYNKNPTIRSFQICVYIFHKVLCHRSNRHIKSSDQLVSSKECIYLPQTWMEPPYILGKNAPKLNLTTVFITALFIPKSGRQVDQHPKFCHPRPSHYFIWLWYSRLEWIFTLDIRGRNL